MATRALVRDVLRYIPSTASLYEDIFKFDPAGYYHTHSPEYNLPSNVVVKYYKLKSTDNEQTGL